MTRDNIGRYSFVARDLHPLRFAGFAGALNQNHSGKLRQ